MRRSWGNFTIDEKGEKQRLHSPLSSEEQEGINAESAARVAALRAQEPAISDDLPAIQKGRIKPSAIVVERECQYTNRHTDWFSEWIAVVDNEATAHRIVMAQKYRCRATKRGMPEISNRFAGKPRKDMGPLHHLLDREGKVLCIPVKAPHEDDVEAVEIRDAAQFPDFMATVCRACLKRINQDGEVIE